MLFYRVCHRKHLTMGPYIDGPGHLTFEMSEMCDDHSCNDTHPSARAIDGFVSGEFSCGFDSLTQLHAWFEGYEEMLRDFGYVIRVWDVTSIVTDEFQCATETKDLTVENFVSMLDVVSDELIERLDAGV